MANICQCGCGESLPEGSTRQYKRGHKNRDVNAVPDNEFVETPAEADTGEPEPFTIDDAARETPNDPEPKDVPEYKPKTTIRVTASVRRDVEGMLAFAFGMSGQMWSMIDPLCGGTMLENGPKLAKAYTPIICQSPSAVKFITKSGKFAMYIEAAVATWPIVQTVFAHHIVKNAGSQLATSNGQMPAPNEYVVQ